MDIKTLSLQAILKPGLAKLYNENGKEFIRSSTFVADFNQGSQTYQGMMEKWLVEFDGGEDVWDFDQTDFKKGNCFLGKPLKRTQHSFPI